MLAVKTRYTFADLLEQAPDDYTLYDILGGELVVWSGPTPAHAIAVTELLSLPAEAQRAGYGQACTAPLAVAFDYADRGLAAQDVTHPDALFIHRSRLDIIGSRCVEAAPDLVVEVLSPSTLADDLPGGRKWAIYDQYGVPYYWIVDLDARTVTQYAWHDGHYGAPVVLRGADLLTCPLFPGVTTTVARIFARIIR